MAVGTDATAQDDKRINKRKEELIRYTRMYERVMQLPANTIEFIDYQEWKDGEQVCGRVKQEAYPGIIYSTSEKCRNVWPSKNLVLHELCHQRMQHHRVSMPSKDKEIEAGMCVTWYYDRSR